MRTLLVLAGLCLTAQAQTLPQYFLGTGTTYDMSSLPKVSLQFGARIGQSNTYSYSIITPSKTGSSESTGILQVLNQSGPWTMGLVGLAGATLTGQAALGSISGGPVLFYDLTPRRTDKETHFHVFGAFRVKQVSSNVTTTEFMAGIGMGI